MYHHHGLRAGVAHSLFILQSIEERSVALVRTPDGFTHKYHPQPRLSANQVGDYLSANATNRRRILKEAKYPPTILLIRYEDAKTALVSPLSKRWRR